MHSNGPKIGITLSEARENPTYRWPARKRFDYVKREYYEAILASGGIPVLLPNTEPPSDLGALIELLDGLLVTGGGDMHPGNFAQEPHPKLGPTSVARDNFELAIIEQMLEERKPILGVCRGHQALNIALGGTLHQDLSCLPHPTLVHADPQQTAKINHNVVIDETSKLFGIIGSSSIETNSSHHQVIDKLGRGLKAVAFAPDGVIEAIEHEGFKFVIGVQWHPEGIMEREHSRRLFKALINGACV
jgi:putative glutamine amidotransferase